MKKFLAISFLLIVTGCASSVVTEFPFSKYSEDRDAVEMHFACTELIGLSDKCIEGLYIDYEQVYEALGDFSLTKGGLKKGTVIFQPNSNYKKYIGTLNKNGQPIEGTLYFKNGQKINYNAGKSTNLVSSNVLPGKKFHTNPYLIFTIIVVGIFLFYKFNDDKYEKKRNKRKLPLIEQITGFMNSPIGTGILMLIIGIALFNLFNWSTTDLEPGRPKFFVISLKNFDCQKSQR